jgi:hypothetical protein
MKTGQWSCLPVADGNATAIRDNKGNIIAVVLKHATLVQDEKGNIVAITFKESHAQKIAAVPDLIEACNEVVKSDGDTLETAIMLANDAVEKTKGDGR